MLELVRHLTFISEYAPGILDSLDMMSINLQFLPSIVRISRWNNEPVLTQMCST